MLKPAVIEGARLDDLEYLRRHSIDRNKVAQELSRIFSRMILGARSRSDDADKQ